MAALAKNTLTARAAGGLGRVCMALLALTLPFTSFPLVARLTGSTMVAPLALLPLLAMLLWLAVYLLRRGGLPSQTRVIFLFLLLAVISSLAAFALAIPPYKGHTLLNREIEGLGTLAVGLGFYLLLSAWLQNAERLRFFLRWVNWGGVLMLAWAFVQVGIWYRYRFQLDWMWNLQGQLSTSQFLFAQRANAFAYEPSWFAHQLNMLYLPYWLGATFSGFSAHRLRLWKISLENVLLLAGVAGLVFSISRVGWLAFLLMAAFMLLLLNLRLVRWLQDRALRRYSGSIRWQSLIRRWFVVFSLLILFLVYAGLLFGALYVMSRYDYRMARVFDLSVVREYSLFYYINQLAFAERVVFWQAGWGVFNDYPILGVGMGNVGFFFPQKLSDFSWGLTEVRQLAYQWTALPNTKSIWIRLLAETGIVGFSVFVTWLLVLWQSARYLRAERTSLARMAGLFGGLVLVGFLIEGFSVDTFALPYYWVSFGFLTAACQLARHTPIDGSQPAP